MESLALFATLVVLGRVLFVVFCVSIAIYTIRYYFADGFLQTRGLPKSPWYWLLLAFALFLLLVQFIATLLS